MTSSLNLASLFPGAIAEHLAIIAQLEAQQKAFERAAILIGHTVWEWLELAVCNNHTVASAAQAGGQ